LAQGGLGASVAVREGDPRRLLTEEARRWGADAIFVGASGVGHAGEAPGLGSVARALVTGAACSLEIAR
jgi:nucleotide-binding universal stress UspA family protein